MERVLEESKMVTRKEAMRLKYAERGPSSAPPRKPLGDMSLDEIVFTSCDMIKCASMSWLESIRMGFKERYTKLSFQSQKLLQRRKDWARLQTFLIAEREGQLAVYPFRQLPETTKVVLNIGGRRFDSTLGEMRAVRGSRLELLFSTRYRVPTLGTSGEYFIDRDPENFKAILKTMKHLIEKKIEKLPGIPRRPSVDMENDMLYFLAPVTECEHIDIEAVDIDAERMDIVEPARPVEKDDESDASTYLKESEELSDHNSVMQYASATYEHVNGMMFELHRRFDAQRLYLEKSEQGQEMESKRMDKMEDYLRRANEAFEGEKAVLRDYLGRLNSAVEIQIGRNHRLRVLTSKPTLCVVPGSLISNFFDKDSPDALSVASEDYFRAPKFVVLDSNPGLFLELLRYLRSWFPRPPPLQNFPDRDTRVKLWKKVTEYGVRTENWADEWLNSLSPEEQWKMHWGEIIENDGGTESMKSRRK